MIYQTPNVTLEHDLQKNILIWTTLGKVSLVDWKESFQQGIEVMEETNCRKWLCDTRQLTHFEKEQIEFLLKTVNETAKQKNWMIWVAHLESKHLIGNLAIDSYRSATRLFFNQWIKLPESTFETKQAAMCWLCRQNPDLIKYCY